MILTIPKYFMPDDFHIAGIYFLLRRGRVIYIGKTTNILGRIKQHSHMRKLYDSVRLIPCHEMAMSKYEKRWIIKFQPRYNQYDLRRWNNLILEKELA